MSDPSAGSSGPTDTVPTSGAYDAERKTAPGAASAGAGNVNSSRAPSSYDVSASRRAVRSTRTPAGYGETLGSANPASRRKAGGGAAGGAGGSKPLRSHTVPVPGLNIPGDGDGDGPSQSGHAPNVGQDTPSNTPTTGSDPRQTNIRAPRHAPTMPVQASSQRTHGEEHEQYNPLGQSSGYVIERLPSASIPSHSHSSNNDNYLAMPIPNDPTNRQSSVSSFQTEPSSYYSAEDNWSNVSASGAPPMPSVPAGLRMSTSTGISIPEPSRQSTSDSKAYPAWMSGPGPTPPMPIPEFQGGEFGEEEEEEDGWRSSPPQMPTPEHYPYVVSEDAPPPGMPEPHNSVSMPRAGHEPTLVHDHQDPHQDDHRRLGEAQDPGNATVRMPEHVSLPSPETHTQSQPPVTAPRPPRLPGGPPSPSGRGSRRTYGPSVVIPPPPKTPPPVPSPDKNSPGGFNGGMPRPSSGPGGGGGQSRPGEGRHGQGEGGGAGIPGYAAAHSGPDTGARPPGAAAPVTVSSTAPLRIQHHAKPSAAAAVGAAGVASSAHGQAAHNKLDAQSASGGGGRVSGPGGQNQSQYGSVKISRPGAASSAASTGPGSRPYGQSNAPPATPSKTESVVSAGPVPGKKPNTHIAASTTPSNLNANQKPSSTQNLAGGGRPSGSTANASSDAHRPSVGATQPQKIPSTSTRPPEKPPPPKQEAHPTASAAVTQATPTRPHLRGAQSQMDTQYVNMLLAIDDIPMVHNLASSFFNWILLAGWILFPGTFTSLRNLSAANGGQVPADLVNAVTNLPLYIVAWVCVGIGGAGMICLWWRWRKNYIWALNKIFAPGLLNSLAGLVSTLSSIFGAQHGQLSTTSKSTLIATGASTAIFAFLTAFYSLWLVRRVKRRHDREVGMQKAGKHGEGVVDTSKRRG